MSNARRFSVQYLYSGVVCDNECKLCGDRHLVVPRARPEHVLFHTFNDDEPFVVDVVCIGDVCRG